MEHGARVFVSSVSTEFRATRRSVSELLEAMGYEPVWQDEFPPEAQTIREMLRRRLEECRSVICLIGHRNGMEGRPLPGDTKRRSYTQLEYDIARELGRPVYLFFAEDEGVGDAAGAPPEEEEKQRRQQEYRAEVKAEARSTGQVFYKFTSREDLLGQLARVGPPEQVTPLQNLPYRSLGTLFKGRSTLLETLRERLQRPGVEDPQAAPQVLHGLGGVGKTRLATEYAWRRRGRYKALLFADASSPERLDQALADLAPVLGLELAILDQPVAERRRAVLSWLRQRPGWLLILDNVDLEDAAEAVEELLPQFSKGHVIVTARVAQWSRQLEELRIDVLEPEDAAAYLRESAGHGSESNSEDDREARLLAERLGYLALALEQAAAYIRHIARMSFRDYLLLWDSAAARLDDANSDDADIRAWHERRLMHRYPHSVATTWLLTRERLGFSSRVLLSTLAWMAPEPMPKSLFEGEAQEGVFKIALDTQFEKRSVKLTDGPAVAAIEASLASALGELEAYSFLHRQSLPATGFTIHRLVQEVTRDLQSPAGRSSWKTAAVFLVTYRFRDVGSVRNWPDLDLLVPHASMVAGHGESERGPTQTAAHDLRKALGHLSFCQGKWKEAELHLRRWLECEPDETSAHASVLHDLAAVLLKTGRYPEGEQSMTRVLAIQNRTLGPGHPETIKTLSALLNINLTLDRLSEAEGYGSQALALATAYHGKDSAEDLSLLSNLATLYERTDRYQDAENTYRRALRIAESQLPRGEKVFGVLLNNFAMCLFKMHRYGEAAVLLERAVTLAEKTMGLEHPELGMVLANLAMSQAQNERFGEAEALYQRAEALQEKGLGSAHPDLADCLCRYGDLLAMMGRLAEAEAKQRRALEIHVAFFGEFHPTSALDMGALAATLICARRTQEASDLLRRHVRITTPGYEEYAHGLILHTGARFLMRISQPQLAEQLERGALDTLVRFPPTPDRNKLLDEAVETYAGIVRELGLSQKETVARIHSILTGEPVQDLKQGSGSKTPWWRRMFFRRG